MDANAGEESSNHKWFGAESPFLADPRLESPPIHVSPTDNFILTFTHRYGFEFNNTTYFDGGVIETFEDHGETWADISTYVNPGYHGKIATGGKNALEARDAYVKVNPSYPNADTVTLDMGTALAGKTVKIRFHIGTDTGAGAVGWEIDDIAFHGITNTPFATLVTDSGTCHAPMAAAGAD